jgi:hypothetical protein
MAAGNVPTVTFNFFTITLPVSRFTQTPIVTLAWVNSGANNSQGVQVQSASTSSIGGYSVSVGTVNWTAVQMTSGSASG